jgi:hypothetical protein
MTTFTNPTTDDEHDPQDCPQCLAAGAVCDFHRGWAAGWDQAASVVGALVLEQRGGQ